MDRASVPRSLTSTIGAREDARTRLLAIVEVEALGRVIEVGDHHGEGFGRAPLALAQFGDGSLVRRITGQMEPTEPLERDDLAGRDQFRGPLDRVGPARPARCVEEAYGRSAGGAGDRLGVEPPIGGIAILTLARIAHRERAHAGALTVVRERQDDREARAAVRAVDEGVAVPAVLGIEQLAQAIGAGRRVRGEQAVAALQVEALFHLEAHGAHRGRLGPADVLDARERRCLRRDRLAEAVEIGRRALRRDLDHPAAVADPAADPEPTRQPPHERSEPDALHHATHLDRARAERGGGRHREPPRAAAIGGSSASWCTSSRTMSTREGTALSTAGDNA